MPTLEDVAAYVRWRPQFAEILDPQYHPLEWLDGEFWAGRAEILFCTDAAALVEIRTYPTGAKEGHGLLCCGELSSIVNELLPRWEDQLRSIGALSATIDSRHGWARALKPLGYAPYQVAVRKEL